MITYVLIGVIVIQVVIHYAERKDLYDRIMAKDYAEYKDEKPSNVHSGISSHSRALGKWRDTGGGNK